MLQLLACGPIRRPCPPARAPLLGLSCWRRPRLQPARADLFGKLFSSSSASSEQSEAEAEAAGEEGGSKMVRLDENSEGGLDGSEKVFGPLAMLAVGYLEEEFERLQNLLVELDAEMIKLLPCTPAMLDGTLGDALSSEPGRHEALPLGTRRVVFLSGMYALEVMEIIAFYKESGLPVPVFAAAVPNNWDRNLRQLVADVYEDHQAMRKKAQQAAAAAAEQQQAGEQQGGGGEGGT